MKQYYVYILSNNSKTLYIGITNNLERRLFEHLQNNEKAFVGKYKLRKLVYFEVFNNS